MARSKVWVEAQEEYLVSRNIEKRDKLVKLSDEELSEYYYKVIEEQGLWDDAGTFVRKWCMDFK